MNNLENKWSAKVCQTCSLPCAQTCGRAQLTPPVIGHDCMAARCLRLGSPTGLLGPRLLAPAAQRTTASARTAPVVAAMTTYAAPTSAQAIEHNLLAVSGLEPHSLWTFFAQLSAIPRPSKQEDK